MTLARRTQRRFPSCTGRSSTPSPSISGHRPYRLSGSRRKAAKASNCCPRRRFVYRIRQMRIEFAGKSLGRYDRRSNAWSNMRAKGLIGLLTPQANTTVEPEFAILMPPGYAFLNARMVSDKPTIEGRLDDYFANMERSIAQFANAPIGAVAFACTGASYLQGVKRERAAVEAIEVARGITFFDRGPRGCGSIAMPWRRAHWARFALSSPPDRVQHRLLA